MFHPFEIAVSGYSNTGKTTLVSRLVSRFSIHYHVGYYKHGCHRFDIDRQGKDSSVVRAAGAQQVVLSDPEHHACIKNGTPSPLALQHWASSLDFLIVEGLKELPLPKLLMVDPEGRILEEVGSHAIPGVLALIVTKPLDAGKTFGLPVFHRDDIEMISRFIMDYFLRSVSATPLFGLVLAGGKSTRMGKDKALLSYHQETQISHTSRMLLKQCREVYISCREDQKETYGRYGFPLITDVYTGIGPLGGLLSAQRQLPGKSWLITACDMPFLNTAVIGKLCAERKPFCFATAIRATDRGRPEPLCAIYEPKCRQPLMLRHAAGNNSLLSFLEDSRVHYLSLKDTNALCSINTQEDHQKALESFAAEKKSGNVDRKENSRQRRPS